MVRMCTAPNILIGMVAELAEFEIVNRTVVREYTAMANVLAIAG